MRLRELRIEKGYTQEYVARLAGITLTTYTNWERDICKPSIDALVHVADIYNVSLDYLVGRSSKRGVGDEQKFEDAP